MSHVMFQDIGEVCPRLAHNRRVRIGFQGDFRYGCSLIFQRNTAKTGSDNIPNRLQIPPVQLKVLVKPSFQNRKSMYCRICTRLPTIPPSGRV
jgi:hypothetical protein